MIWAQKKLPAQISLSNSLCTFCTPLTRNVLSYPFTCSSLLFVSLFQRAVPTMNCEQGKECGCCSWSTDAFSLVPKWQYERSTNVDPVEDRDGCDCPCKMKSQQFFNSHLQSQQITGRAKEVLIARFQPQSLELSYQKPLQLTINHDLMLSDLPDKE